MSSLKKSLKIFSTPGGQQRNTASAIYVVNRAFLGPTFGYKIGKQKLGTILSKLQNA
jgi:hypothetical protein